MKKVLAPTGVVWDKRGFWLIKVRRNKILVLNTARASLFEACCLVKSLNAKEQK